MKHTPGPWEIKPYSTLDKRITINGPDGLTLDYDDVDHAQQGIDARLIAAAPELLEVAKRLLGLAQDLHFTGSLIDLAEAAIAKAEGQ